MIVVRISLSSRTFYFPEVFFIENKSSFTNYFFIIKYFIFITGLLNNYDFEFIIVIIYKTPKQKMEN